MGWSYSAGEYGQTVRVYERTPGGIIYISLPDLESPGRYVRRSLEHRDREEAKAQADEASAELHRGLERIEKGEIHLSELFALYERHHVPRLSEAHAEATKRRLAMWLRLLGPKRDPHTLTRQDWQSFIDLRRAGRIDARGKPGTGKRVRPVTVIRDLECLRAVCQWGYAWRDRQGRPLLREDPTRGLRMPEDRNPRRPTATRDRYRRLRKVAPQVNMVRWWGPRPRRGPSYLPEILDIVAGTGRRIAAVLSLRYSDLRLDRAPAHPCGAIRWPADTDKMGREQVVPVTPTVRRALDRIMEERPGLGDVWLFPASSDPEKPCPTDTANMWLFEAERLAGLAPLDGGNWHPYRRMWATERKHFPLPDLARAGGWASQQTLQKCYLSADEETTLRVVMNGSEAPESGAETG